MAKLLADLFVELYEIANPSGGSVLVDWYTPLIKLYHGLSSIPGQKGVTAKQLLTAASMKTRQKETWEIYLAVPVDLTSSMQCKLNLPAQEKKRGMSGVAEEDDNALQIHEEEEE
ncbi:hypothetical protein FRC09_020575 [Ceratobasidium sp. 395]|nr:hypothetical protein FRC09_020575 [Ceratobasidium sp. 395]